MVGVDALLELAHVAADELINLILVAIASINLVFLERLTEQHLVLFGSWLAPIKSGKPIYHN